MAAHALPDIINLELTNACNLACVFCDHKDLVPSMEITSMEPALLRRILDGLGERRFNELGLVGLGEPLLDASLDSHLAIIQEFAPRFGMISLNTNIVALTPQKAERICRSSITHVTISLNAANRASYAELMGADCFDRAIGNIRLFMQTRRRLGTGQQVSIQVMSSPLNEVSEVEVLLGPEVLADARLFVREVYSKPVLGSEDDRLNIHKGPLDRHPCWSLYSRLYIDVQGNAYPCTVGNDCYRERSNLCLGNVREQDAVALFNNPRARRLREAAEQGAPSVQECADCNIWSLLPNHFHKDQSGRYVRAPGPARRKDLDWAPGQGTEHD